MPSRERTDPERSAKWLGLLSGVLVAAAGLLIVSSASRALEVGQAAPEFEMMGSDGKVYTLDGLKKEHKGIVLAFFPMAFTPG